MDLERLSRLMISSAIMTLMFGVGLAVWRLDYALGIVVGGLWSTLNIWVWKVLLDRLLHNAPKGESFLWANIKLPLLYGGGALVLYLVPLSIGALLVGFHIPFVVIVIEAIRLSIHPMPSPGPRGQDRNAG